jgi:hypothetical protein
LWWGFRLSVRRAMPQALNISSQSGQNGDFW